MEQYAQMKSSGVSWIQDIPSNWSIRVLFQLADQVKNKNKDLIEQNLLSLSYGKIKRKDINNPEGLLPESFDGYNIIEANDIVLRLTDLQNDHTSLRVGQAKERGIITSAYTTLRPSSIVSPQYLYYAMYAYDLIKGFYGMGSGVRQGLNYDEVKTLKVPFPTMKEQETIVAFLDNKVEQIDSVIDETKVIVEEYKKWKEAVIFETVTKGLNSNVELKDSGIEGIGDIPYHWRVTKTLHCLSMAITDGPHTTPELFDDGIPFISAEAVSCGNGKIDFSHMRGYISEEFYNECCKKYVPEVDDVYMIKSGATTGRVAIVDTDKIFTIWSPLAVFRANKDRIIPRYLFYALQSDYYQKQVELGWTYGTQQNIGMRTLETLKICLPPLDEQKKIVEYLEKKCGYIENLIAEKEAVVDDLTLYKKSIIYEVVTGKRKVV